MLNEGSLDESSGSTFGRDLHLHLRKFTAYALRMVDRITRRSIQIAEHPLSGRSVPEYGVEQVREVFSGPYRIVYHIKANQIDVVAVIHGAMQVVHDEQESS